MSGCLDFKVTGVDCIDNIINALEDASSGYHSTGCWNDTDDFDTVSYADKLQAAFDCASKEFKKEIFVFIGEDRHIDVQVELFSTFELAKERCDEWIKTAGYEDDFEESTIDGWLYNATYGGEGDSVRIESKTIDSK